MIKLGRYERKLSWRGLTYPLRIYLEGLGKTTKKLGAEYEVEVLLIRP